MPSLQGIFYQNQFWDAKSLLIKFIRWAKKELIVIHAYPGVRDTGTPTLFAYRRAIVDLSAP